MHSSLNVWNGIGNVGRNIDLRYVGTTPILEFSICVDNVDVYPGPGGKPKKLHTRDWVPVQMRGNEAELNYRALQCGSHVCITGRLKVGTHLYVEVDHIQWLANIRNPNPVPATAVAEA
jgi:single-stranded DNA-binding protein